MTLLIRLATTIVLFVFLFVVVYFAICIVGGAVSGGIAGANHPQDSYNAGQQAGANFVRHNIRVIVFGSFVISLVSSVALSFSGLLPWCRKPARPPELPPS
jgi:hypothetical protein